MFSFEEKMWMNSCAKADAIRKFRIILEVRLILWLDFASVQVFFGVIALLVNHFYRKQVLSIDF